jgi:uncharacterized glyoxalase superfamily protein PhnB
MTAQFEQFPAIVPTLRYGDLPRAIDWLCEAFGFEKHLLVGDEEGGIVYAELSLGGSMVMLAPADGSAFDALMKQPDQIGGVETQICYLYVRDAGAQRDRAVAAGAEIVLDIDGEGSTGRGFSCRDPEGHIWNFGTYNPWATLPASASASRRRRTLLLSSLVLLIPAAAALLFGVPEQVFAEKDGAGVSWSEAKATVAGDSDLGRELARMRAAKEASEQALRALEEQLALERSAHQPADRSTQETQDEQGKPRTVVASIGAAASAAGAEVERERNLRLAAEQGAREVRQQLEQAHSTNEATERTLREVRGQLASERLKSERLGRAGREQAAKQSKQALATRAARHRAARLAARARIRRLREAHEPSIKPSLPYF